MSVKLPLITRKNIRDEFDAKIPSIKAKVDEITGQSYELTVNFQDLYSKIDTSESYQSESTGTIAYNAFDSFLDQLKRISDDGENKTVTEFFNNVVSSRKVTVDVTEDCPSYSACRVKDGVFEIIYKKGSYGTNTSYACSDMMKELDKYFAANNKGSLPLEAKKGFQEDFMDKKEKLEKQISEELLDAKITLVADAEAIWKIAVDAHDKLKRNEKDKIDMESISRNMGAAIYNYFDGLLGTLKYKFKQDDMMVEAFMEECSKGEIRFELVPEGGLSKGRSYNDAIFQDGGLVIRTTPDKWYTNCSYATEDIDKLL